MSSNQLPENNTYTHTFFLFFENMSDPGGMQVAFQTPSGFACFDPRALPTFLTLSSTPKSPPPPKKKHYTPIALAVVYILQLIKDHYGITYTYTSMFKIGNVDLSDPQGSRRNPSRDSKVRGQKDVAEKQRNSDIITTL